MFGILARNDSWFKGLIEGLFEVRFSSKVKRKEAILQQE